MTTDPIKPGRQVVAVHPDHGTLTGLWTHPTIGWPDSAHLYVDAESTDLTGICRRSRGWQVSEVVPPVPQTPPAGARAARLERPGQVPACYTERDADGSWRDRVELAAFARLLNTGWSVTEWFYGPEGAQGGDQ
jgi:hypothetical protein